MFVIYVILSVDQIFHKFGFCSKVCHTGNNVIFSVAFLLDSIVSYTTFQGIISQF